MPANRRPICSIMVWGNMGISSNLGSGGAGGQEVYNSAFFAINYLGLSTPVLTDGCLITAQAGVAICSVQLGYGVGTVGGFSSPGGGTQWASYLEVSDAFIPESVTWSSPAYQTVNTYVVVFYSNAFGSVVINGSTYYPFAACVEAYGINGQTTCLSPYGLAPARQGVCHRHLVAHADRMLTGAPAVAHDEPAQRLGPALLTVVRRPVRLAGLPHRLLDRIQGGVPVGRRVGAGGQGFGRLYARRVDKRPEVAVGGIALRGGEILLIRRAQEPSKGCWSVPGGRVEWGETLEEALLREMAEETGLTVQAGALAGIVERRYPPDFHYVILDYYVTPQGGDLRPGGDVSDARWVPLAALPQLPLSDGLAASLRAFGLPLGSEGPAERPAS